ncbi:L-arabinose isomerase family protein [Thermococcus sp.]
MAIERIWDTPLLLQPLKMESALERWLSDETPIAKQTWVFGPKKPRDQLRNEELPPRDVHIEKLAEEGIVEVLPQIRIKKKEDVDNIPEDSDLLVIGDMEDWMASEEILDALARLGKPIMPQWDSWGYSIHGRLSKFRLDKYSNVKHIIPMGADDVLNTLSAIRAAKALRTLKVLYIGKYPPRSVAVPKEVTLEYIHNNVGPEVKIVEMDEYLDTIWKIDDEKAEKVANEWKKRFKPENNMRNDLNEVAKIYLALRKLLEKYKANSLTVECPAIPAIEYVPCVAFSLLIDDGIPSGCEGDLPALFTMTALMAISGKAALMGNLNENVTHWDIENGIITINHDVMPPSYACPLCKIKIKDYHGTKMGATLYSELVEGAPVTLAGIHWNMNKMWATEGEIAWTMDTVHCRLDIGVKVNDSKTISKIGFGHHIVLAYGRYMQALRRFADLMGFEFIEV